MADDDDFDYDYDPLFDVSTQCSCEDPVEDDHPSGKLNVIPGQGNSLPNPERRRINAESGASVRGVSKGRSPAADGHV